MFYCNSKNYNKNFQLIWHSSALKLCIAYKTGIPKWYSASTVCFCLLRGSFIKNKYIISDHFWLLRTLQTSWLMQVTFFSWSTSRQIINNVILQVIENRKEILSQHAECNLSQDIIYMLRLFLQINPFTPRQENLTLKMKIKLSTSIFFFHFRYFHLTFQTTLLSQTILLCWPKKVLQEQCTIFLCFILGRQNKGLRNITVLIMPLYWPLSH